MNIADLININPRINVRKELPLPHDAKCVVYWMQRSQRAASNQAFDTAVKCANALKLPLAVVFILVRQYQGSTDRHYRFMLAGLAETEAAIRKRGAGFFVCETENDVHESVISITAKLNAALLLGDENPLKIPSLWRDKITQDIDVSFITIDSDVVVPSSLFIKEEYAARTLRLKLKPLISLYLDEPCEIKPVKKWNNSLLKEKYLCFDSITETLLWRELSPVKNRETDTNRFQGGRSEGLAKLSYFIDERLTDYAVNRNKPELSATSRLSPYLHFGQISPAEAAMAALSLESEGRDAFIEELIVRRELAINYVLRNRNYDSFDGFHEWAKKSLLKHSSDKREYLYTTDQFENGKTHDLLWNAAQKEMTETGHMHGYLRMYWAKKILEWSTSPREAFDTALYLNDKYQLDGRDPNGYTGIAWSIGGKHDRPWGPERPVFGLIRFMNAAGMKRKFDTAAYISKFNPIPG